MAVYYARKSGNINATDVWATTPTGTAGNFFSSFTNQDVLMANGFIVTINVNTTVKEIRGDFAYGANDNGSSYFSITASNITLTANIYTGNANLCLGTSFATGSCTIIGSIYGGENGGGSAGAITHSGAGTLNIIGNIFGGTTSQSVGVSCRTATGTVNITGNVYGGKGGNAHGVDSALIAGCTINITGNVFGSSAGFGSTGSAGVYVGVNSTITITGSVVGTFYPGLRTNTNISPTVSVVRAKGGPFLNSAVGVQNQSTLIVVSIDEAEYGDNGTSPTSGRIAFTNKTSNIIIMYRENNNKKILMDTNNISFLPSISNVRSGIVYNSGNNTGTCAIPSLSNVLSGVPCDSGVGIGALSPADIWNILTTNLNTSGSMGERLKNCATITSVGQQISNIIGT